MPTLTACRGWTNPNSNYYVPIISSLSTYNSPVGVTALVVIFGNNFKSFSTIKFGIYTPITYFVSSEQISFYISSTFTAGIYPIQVFNDVSGSNVVNYTIDGALVGYWTSDNNAITNTNIDGGIVISGNSITNGDSTINGNSIVISDLNVQGIITGLSTLDITGPITGQSTLNISGAITGQSTLNITGPITGLNTLTISGAITGLSTLIITGAATAASFTSTSDYRIKDVIEPLNSSYSVSNLKPIKYLNKITGCKEIGFLAHEVQEVFPCLVTGEKDGEHNQTINYIGLIGVLVQEIQQLKADILLLKR